MYSTRLFFAVILVTGGVLSRPVAAAPAVKTFNNTTSTSAYGNVRAKGIQTTPTTAATTKGASTARTLGLTTKPMTKAAKGTYVGTTKATGSVDSSRTPGKHGNILKGISSKLSANYSSQQGGGGSTTDLEQRVTGLETEITTKQDILTPGDGISISGDTISVTTDIMELPDKVDGMSQELSSLAEQIGTAPLPSDYSTTAETQAYLEENYYNQQSVNDIIGALANREVADTFSESIFDGQ